MVSSRSSSTEPDPRVRTMPSTIALRNTRSPTARQRPPRPSVRPESVPRPEAVAAPARPSPRRSSMPALTGQARLWEPRLRGSACSPRPVSSSPPAGTVSSASPTTGPGPTRSPSPSNGSRSHRIPADQRIHLPVRERGTSPEQWNPGARPRDTRVPGPPALGPWTTKRVSDAVGAAGLGSQGGICRRCTHRSVCRPRQPLSGYLCGTELAHGTGFMPCAGSAAHGRGAGAP